MRFWLLWALALIGSGAPSAAAWPALAPVGLQEPPKPPAPVPPEPEPPAPEPPAPAPEPPSAESIAATLKSLAEALKTGSPEEQIAAVEAAREVRAKEIVKALVETTEAEIPEVRRAALDSLGRMDFEPALEELKKLAKRARKLLEDDVLCAELYKAISRYGRGENLAMFAKAAFKTDRPQTTRACILAFGKVRTHKSLEELIALMNRAPMAPGQGPQSALHLGEFRLALHVLTGLDQGNERSAWQAWWNDNKKIFEVAPEEPELERGLGNLWRAYWEGREAPRGDGGGRR
jgi:hypothetical protein